MKTLLLMRHTKTEGASTASSDHGRMLTERGKRDADRIGILLAELGLTPDVALVSDAERTRQTWQCLSRAARYEMQARFEASLYLAAPGAYMRLLTDLPEDTETVLCIGHNPGIETLMRQLAHKVRNSADQASIAQPVRTGTLCGFAVDGTWADLAPHAAELTLFLRP